MRKAHGKRTFAGMVAVAAMVAPTASFGYGVELPENGTISFGRAGASLNRPIDPSTVMHNPAGIMGLPGVQLTVSSNFGFFDHCFQRAGNYEGPGAGVRVTNDGTVFTPMGASQAPYTSGRVPYPETCKNFSLGLAPMVLGTWRINRYIGIGFGVFAPSTQGRTQHFPDTVTARDPMSGMSFMAPSPARHLLFRKDLLVLYPTISVAVQPTHWLRVGLGIHPSVGNYRFGLHANGVASEPQSPASDVFIELDATGFFMAATLGVQIMPTSFLSFAANMRYNFPLDASGEASNVGSVYSANPANRVPSTFTIESLRVQLPWNLRAGVRYNLPRRGRPTQNDGTGLYDPMTDDVFDVEATFTYENTSDLSETSLTNSGTIAIDPVITTAAPREITIRSALSNVYGFRIGGDYNIIPGVLAVRAGGSYETAGVSPDLAQIHLPAYAGGSLHVGASYRWKWLTISLGYGHFFFENNDASAGRRAVTVPAPSRNATIYPATPEGDAAWQANLTRQGFTPQGQIDPAVGCSSSVMGGTARGQGACTINQGVYRASFDSVSLGFSFRW
jgi:long-chain fatty acid transport protein